MTRNILWFKDLGIHQIAEVGGKNASLGEMMKHLSSLGIRIPNGFATTAQAYQEFLKQDALDQQIKALLTNLDPDDIQTLAKTGRLLRQKIIETPFLPDFEKEVITAYETLIEESGAEHAPLSENTISVAVRSSATAEDLPEASFAGQQETFLNIQGVSALMHAIKEVFASLFNDRAIAYRCHQGFDHHQIALSAGIQRMVRSDCASSGVMFTMDTESGFNEVVFITGAYGLGETVVQGSVNPDEFYVYKPALRANHPSAVLRRNLGEKAQKMIYAEDKNASRSTTIVPVPESERQRFCLSDSDILELARYALSIEMHYQKPMDIEWAKDGIDGLLYIVQARPETVKSRDHQPQVIERFQLASGKNDAVVLAEGRSIGQRIGQGCAKILKHIEDMNAIQPGDVLVTDMTDPDWEPIMKKASAIVTNRGGRTCHAAIIARELGIPAVVGCGDATSRISDGAEITVSCAEGDTGKIYAGLLKFDVQRMALDKMPPLPIDIMMNVGDPDRAFDFSFLPHKGVGLARLEFIINRMIGIHPKALLNFEQLPHELRQKIETRISAYPSPVEFYIQRLQEGIATIAAAFAPQPVIFRLSDFKSNEYANLLGGEPFEPKEENPMLGFRGASRYLSEEFADCFAMECEAVKRVRNMLGLTNVAVMIPFVRTVEEAKQVTDLLAQNGLRRGENGLRLIMMCELPSNAILADAFLEYFDGFSIGSNDLTQLTLGLDRDSGLIANLFDERDPAVKFLLEKAIQACKKSGKYIGICGQGPSDHPDLARWLVDQGISSISLNPDSVLKTWLYLANQK